MKKNFTRILSCVIALVMAISMFGIMTVFAGDHTPVYDGTSVSESLQGEGTEASPYLIANGADLKYFEQNAAATTGKYYKLTADIIWSNYTSASDVLPTASNWTPVKFDGNFDGDGHYIAGINVVSASKSQGFFTEAYGIVKNLTITDSYFKGTEGVAGFVGIVQPTKGDVAPSSLEIINCKNYATVDGSTDVAGIVGKAFANAKTDQTKLRIVVKQCVNYGKIYGSNATVYAGGLVGRAYGYGTDSGIFECVNYGDVVPTNAKPAVVGGIVAQVGINDVPTTVTGYAFTISDCINYGRVAGYRLVGGIIGRNYPNCTVKNSVNVGEVTMSAVNSGDSAYEGQFGAIAGANGGKFGTSTIENCFYLAGSAKNVTKTDDVSTVDALSTVKTDAELNSEAMATALGDKWTYSAAKGLTLVAFANADITPPAPETPDVTTTTSSEVTTKPTDDVTTTVPSGNDTTTIPAGNDTTTAPTDNDTTTKPADNDTTTVPADNDTTTEKPADNTTKPDTTTEAPAKKKSCGGFAIAAQLVAVLGAGLTVVVLKKKI